MSKNKVLDKYRVEITRQTDGSYLAVCDEVQGVYAEGKTYLDVMLNIEDILRNVLELNGAEEKLQKPGLKFNLQIPNPLYFGLTA
ncbi:MAG: type II toxin-antitoxin system HicB family antitoxin [Patescibacteria group bacterium]